MKEVQLRTLHVATAFPVPWSESIGKNRFRPMYAAANMGHPSRYVKETKFAQFPAEIISAL
jgi:hypothetical protein